MKTFEEKLSRLKLIQQVIRHQKFLSLLNDKRFGISKSKVEALELLEDDKIEMKQAGVKPAVIAPGEEYYVYDGPPAERDFCVYMLKIDKVFLIDEIKLLSELMGYDVFEYQPGKTMKKGGPGGPNCKHKWKKFRGKVSEIIDVPTNRQIDALVNRNIFPNQ